MQDHFRKVEFWASRDWNSFGKISLRGGERSSTHSPAAFQSMTLKTVDEGEIVSPFLTLEEEEAQSLMDALWSAGVRPTEGHGSTGQLAATEKHLEDMRSLLFLHEGLSPTVRTVQVNTKKQ